MTEGDNNDLDNNDQDSVSLYWTLKPLQPQAKTESSQVPFWSDCLKNVFSN